MRRHAPFLFSLIVIALGSFWPVGQLGFINYDDADYITENVHVKTGLTFANLGWALTSLSSANWHPLTWVSHMLDCQIFGLSPAGPHWVNLALHSLSTALLYLWLWQLTGSRWRSFFVAVLFACHPLNIESVAWISERKNVLSMVFALLTLMAYTKFARHRSRGTYLLTFVLMALGLMAKPMLVVLPVAMLLLDFWPLGRARKEPDGPANPPMGFPEFFRVWAPLVVEKTPFFVISLIDSIITCRAQTDCIIPLATLPLGQRLAHALYAYSLYLGKIIWPAKLAIFYPIVPMTWPWLITLMLLPVGLCGLFLSRRRIQHWLFFGWFWFFLLFLPMIGLVQVGLQSIADRYVYLTAVGLFIALAWTMAEIAALSPAWKKTMVLIATIMVLACMVETRHQLHYWKNTLTIFQRVTEVTPTHNYQGYYLLGSAYQADGKLDLAVQALEEANQSNPDYRDYQFALGDVLAAQSKYDLAEAQFRKIIQVDSNDLQARRYLVNVLTRQNKIVEARKECQWLLATNPNDPQMLKALKSLTPKSYDELTLESLTQEETNHPTAFILAEIALLMNSQGNFTGAASHFQAALKLNPEDRDVENYFAWFLATCPEKQIRNGPEAIRHAQHACELAQHTNTVFLGTLAAAYAEAGRFGDAIAMAQKACTNATTLGETDLLKRNQELLELYRQHQPYHEAVEALVPN